MIRIDGTLKCTTHLYKWYSYRRMRNMGDRLSLFLQVQWRFHTAVGRFWNVFMKIWTSAERCGMPLRLQQEQDLYKNLWFYFVYLNNQTEINDSFWEWIFNFLLPIIMIGFFLQNKNVVVTYGFNQNSIHYLASH